MRARVNSITSSLKQIDYVNIGYRRLINSVKLFGFSAAFTCSKIKLNTNMIRVPTKTEITKKVVTDTDIHETLLFYWPLFQYLSGVGTCDISNLHAIRIGGSLGKRW